MNSKPKALKILVSGDVEGNFDKLFGRVNAIQKKSGSFDLLLCVGEFFGKTNTEWEKYKSGQSKVPIPTLILGPCDSSLSDVYQNNKDGLELCDNVTYLGRRGTFTGSSGLSLAYLSGVEGERSDMVHFSSEDVSTLLLPVESDTKFRGVDILLTSQWPKNPSKYASNVEVDTETCGSSLISQLAIWLKPRYHFCGCEDVFYERQPYRNHKVLAEKEKHVTRFISLAKVNSSQKKKYLYAFNITPMCNMEEGELTKQPPDVTECPYPKESLGKLVKEESTQQFFFGDTKSSDKGKKRPREEKLEPGSHKKHPRPSGPCWFCLGSPEVEKHLVVSVGTECYLALAKGGLVQDHTLILPIGHHQSMVLAPDDVREEIDKYKKALAKFYKQTNRSVIFFERNYKTQHLQIQAVPFPDYLKQEAKESFMECAESESINLDEIPKHSDLKQIVPVGAPYFYTELPTGEKLLHRISKNFPLQFGREVLASVHLLNMPERVDWKVCKLRREEEEIHAEEFRNKFEQFDFNLQ
ncbi:CWF19-like protein 1 [Saccostrea echinata]|uniref:CWF19-like protein 1 n=1 Tax=Saccostrea echinata TaxID=191078 RepID=UPI002A82F429|nr:CWF19-like protein 1 [Saccostrea echinata]